MVHCLCPQCVDAGGFGPEGQALGCQLSPEEYLLHQGKANEDQVDQLHVEMYALGLGGDVDRVRNKLWTTSQPCRTSDVRIPPAHMRPALLDACTARFRPRTPSITSSTGPASSTSLPKSSLKLPPPRMPPPNVRTLAKPTVSTQSEGQTLADVDADIATLQTLIFREPSPTPASWSDYQSRLRRIRTTLDGVRARTPALQADKARKYETLSALEAEGGVWASSLTASEPVLYDAGTIQNNAA